MKTLVIGGACSGKSEYAEKLCLAHGGNLSYIATMQAFGEDAAIRIKRHQKLREGKGFHTLEYSDSFTERTLPGGTVLLECLGNLVANELFAQDSNESLARSSLVSGMRALEQTCDNLIVVTNDIFADGTFYSKETQTYTDLLAEMNRKLAAYYDKVVEVVCSIPLWHKGTEQ